jgi:hypothetical protein
MELYLLSLYTLLAQTGIALLIAKRQKCSDLDRAMNYKPSVYEGSPS